VLLAEVARLQALVDAAAGFAFHPEGCDKSERDAWRFAVTVEYRGANPNIPGREWAVVVDSQTIGRDGSRRFEPLPSNRDDEYLTGYRFTFEEATTLAREEASRVTYAGMTWAEWAALRKAPEG